LLCDTGITTDDAPQVIDITLDGPNITRYNLTESGNYSWQVKTNFPQWAGIDIVVHHVNCSLEDEDYMLIAPGKHTGVSKSKFSCLKFFPEISK
jgi:hypothetical protein